MGLLDGDLVGKCERELAWCVRWSVTYTFTTEYWLVKVGGVLVRKFSDGSGLGEMDKLFHGKTDRR